ncbi:MAG TPA: helix-turn-helix domain-containing protein [Gaiellaceae bacterium]|nr:helix-turn-helix domain-containing protein [Gaiellaceae bacterium]
MTTSDAPAYLCVAEVAQTLGLSEATVYRRVWDGSLPVVRLSEHGAIRIPTSVLTEFARPSEPPPVRRGPAGPRVDSRLHGGGDKEAA